MGNDHVLDAAYHEWQSLRAATDPARRRRFIELTIQLKTEAPTLFADIVLPALALCPHCQAIRETVTPGGLLRDHDHHGTLCPGSNSSPLRVLRGSLLIDALVAHDANRRGDFCASAPAADSHDTSRCPCRGRRP